MTILYLLLGILSLLLVEGWHDAIAVLLVLDFELLLLEGVLLDFLVIRH